MKHLLVVHHSQSGSTQQLVDAACQGVEMESGVELRKKDALDANHLDLEWADGLIFATPENFGYMSGALKTFFDRTFYKVEHLQLNLPYSLIVKAGNDGSGAVTAVQRIARGYPFRQVAEPLLVKGDLCPDDLLAARDLGQAMAAGLLMGIF